MKKQTNSLIYTSVLCLAFSSPLMAAKGAGMEKHDMSASEKSEERVDAKETVNKAAEVVQRLKANAETRSTLSQAKAVFIVPNYGRAALGIGGAGGEGVLVANNNGTWSSPAFYNIGSISLGLSAGVEAGSIAFLVMTDKGLDGFDKENNFSLNADAGVTVVNWSKRGQLSAGKGADVIVWADTEGLYGDLSVSVADIKWDGEANQSYYSRTVTARDILNGTAQDPQANGALRSEFSALETARPTTTQTNPANSNSRTKPMSPATNSPTSPATTPAKKY